MALFSRRCLRRLLDENAKFLEPQQLDEHSRRLDKIRDDYLATEWEIVILNSLSKVGTVKHEPTDLGGRRFLDVVFSSPNVQFGADIATVSDQQLHKRNPVDQIWEELARRVQKRKITTGGFDLAIGHSPEASRGRGFRHDLLIPPINKLRDTIFNRDFDAFLGRIVSNPLTRYQFRVQNSSADITISYDPTRKSWGGSHLAYTNATIVDDNPVFNALKQKTGHLKGSGYEGPRGVIVCDGGCQMLSSDGVSWEGFTLRQVVGDFLRQNQSIAFVITIGLNHDRSSSIGRGHYKPCLGVWVPRAFAPLKIPLQFVFERMISYLPIIETSATNALYRVKDKDRRASHFGGSVVGGNRYAKFSAITILELLAGKLDYDTFSKAHRFDQRNPFADALREGRVIQNCKIESEGEEDDDWIRFEFGEPDPAITRFSKPKRT